MKSSRRLIFASLTASIMIIVAIGCSTSGTSSSVPASATEKSPPLAVGKTAPTATAVQSAVESDVVTPTEVPAPTVEPTSVTAPTAVPIATNAPVATAEPTATIAPAATSIPQSTPTPEPTATPVPLTNVYNSYGFTIELDQDATFATSNLNVGGWSGTDADTGQGLMTFNYNGADIVIFWQPQNGDTPQNTVDLTYQLQQLGNPDLTFAPLSDGALTVDGGPGRFAGFLTSDTTGGNASGGLIGAWTCPSSETQLSLTATGSDSTALQIRFDRLTSGFSCTAN